jgi:tripartite-type tricarboxylate transporter receptor subunit TctC
MASMATASIGVAQTYPVKPIKLVVPFPAGGATDTTARLVAQRLQLGLGQSVIIENQGGAGGTIAAKQVAGAPPDGYTLMMGSLSTFGTHPVLYKLDYDPMKAFTPVASAVVDKLVMVAGPALSVKSVQELVAYARANPGKLNYGSSGMGSPHHLAGELIRQKTGIDIIHVPYRGGGATINDLIGGHIKVAFLSLSTAVPHLTSGKIKILAVVEKARYAALPDVPTVGETVPGFEMSSWHGFFAPATTPVPLVARLNAAITKVLDTSEVKDKLAVLGVAVATSTPGELAELVKSGLAARGELIKAANIQPE